MSCDDMTPLEGWNLQLQGQIERYRAAVWDLAVDLHYAWAFVPDNSLTDARIRNTLYKHAAAIAAAKEDT